MSGNMENNNNARQQLSDIQWFSNYTVNNFLDNGITVSSVIRFGLGRNHNGVIDVIIPFLEMEKLANDGVINRNPEQLQNLKDFLKREKTNEYEEKSQMRRNSRMWKRGI